MTDRIFEPDVSKPAYSDVSSNTATKHLPLYRGATISGLISVIFVCSSIPKISFKTLPVQDMDYLLHIDNAQKCCIVSSFINVTIQKLISALCDLEEPDSMAFMTAIQDELLFLIKDFFRTIRLVIVLLDVALQSLKLVFSIKRSNHAQKPARHKAQQVSASNRPALRPFVHGNALTIAFSTIHALAAILPTWITMQFWWRHCYLSRCHKRLSKKHSFTMTDNLKALRIVFQILSAIRRSCLASCGSAIRRSWSRVIRAPYFRGVAFFVFWELQRSIFDVWFIYCATSSVAILTCTDDILVAFPQSRHSKKGEIRTQF